MSTTPTTIADVVAIAAQQQFLAVVTTVRVDLSVQSSLVNAGFIAHPASGEQVLAYVTYGPVKLANLRARPATAATFVSGWRYATVEGVAELIGPDDPHDAVDAEALRLLLRQIFVAAGGDHDDWSEYDRVVQAQHRTAVLIRPTRIYG